MLTFPNITPAVFEAVLNELRQEATVTPLAPGGVSGKDHWQIVGSGITAEVMHINGEVMVNIQDKPWWMAEALIKSKIQAAIETGKNSRMKLRLNDRVQDIRTTPPRLGTIWELRGCGRASVWWDGADPARLGYRTSHVKLKYLKRVESDALLAPPDNSRQA